MDHYIIKTKKFEGPFDLILYFIDRDELDINDIPIAKITDDFLAYIKKLEELNIDVASEFILVAATLMKIKSRMLIPRKEIDEEGNEIDPREELKQRLIEYMQYKSVLKELSAMEDERGKKMIRGNINTELKRIGEKALVDVELENLTLYRLFSTFQRLLDEIELRKKQHTVHQIINYNYTIQEQREYLMSNVKLGGKKADFNDVFGKMETRIHAIVTFLALLELINQQMLKVLQGEGYNNFWLIRRDTDEEE